MFFPVAAIHFFAPLLTLGSTEVAEDVVPLLSLASLLSFITLAGMEIVLGVDNVIMIAITTSRLPLENRYKIQKLGISLAVIVRVGLLCSIKWIMGLTKPLFEVFGHEISGHSLVLILGGLFLIGKATHEIHEKLEQTKEEADQARALTQQNPETPSGPSKPLHGIGYILAQILLIDIVFSFDSVITAVGMSNQIWIMIAAVVAAAFVMMVFSRAVSVFVDKHPTMKMLALAFLILIGVLLVAEGLGHHIDKGYIYFAMAFALAVEGVNIRMSKLKNG
jgi:predicted tellurium resistance membrane protein TerC